MSTTCVLLFNDYHHLYCIYIYINIYSYYYWCCSGDHYYYYHCYHLVVNMNHPPKRCCTGHHHLSWEVHHPNDHPQKVDVSIDGFH